MLRLHYVLYIYGSPKLSSPWGFGHFCLRIQVLLRLITYSHRLSIYTWQTVCAEWLAIIMPTVCHGWLYASSWQALFCGTSHDLPRFNPRSAVGNVSGNRCESDCRSRGREFDPGPVPYFCGDWSWNNFYGHSPPFRWIIQEGLLSVTICLFDLIFYVHSTIFQLCGTVLPGFNQY